MKYDIRSTALPITGEAHTITDGVIKLNETASDIVITGFTEVTGTPNAGEFKPLYFTDTYGREVAGILQFNVADEETDVTVVYNGYGSIIWADDWNELLTNIGSQTYTEQNYVADDETLTESIDKLDMALKDTDQIITAYDLKNTKKYKWTLQMSSDGQPQIKFEEVV